MSIFFVCKFVEYGHPIACTGGMVGDGTTAKTLFQIHLIDVYVF